MTNRHETKDITLDFTRITAAAAGEEHGISDKQLKGLQNRAGKIHRALMELRQKGEVGFYDLPNSDTSRLKKFASRVREKYENLVVLGIGGSALGTTAVHAALRHGFSHLLTKRKRNGYPKLFVVDNIDPDYFSELMDVLDPKKTLFNVISKSGTTAETMAQFMIVFDRLKKRLKGKWKKRVVITTDPAKGLLRAMVDEYNLASFEIPPNIGGRFSVCSAAGLMPLACAGVDIDGFLAGAAQMSARCETGNIVDNPAYLLGSLLYLADTAKGKSMAVMMPYSTKLYGMADWFRQLWAESLGKRRDVDGREVYVGQTPIKALGVTDQHSQVQLYVEGPFDKVVIFVKVENFAKRVDIPELFTDKKELSYLAGSSLNELIKVEMEGTRYALEKHKKVSITITLPEISANTLGQFIFMLEAATAFAGGLYGVNPFDQPGVEFGKNYSYAVMGRKGYEKLRNEIKEQSGKIPARIL
ncbi:MAG: glucose-6-phosphate isomerase [bacterium]|nr:MAG: glucose-6-phosphate isomerase [bacterium]